MTERCDSFMPITQTDLDNATSVYSKINQLENKIVDILIEIQPYEGQNISPVVATSVHSKVNNIKLELNKFNLSMPMNNIEKDYLQPSAYKALHAIVFNNGETDADSIIEDLMAANLQLGYSKKELNDRYEVES